MLKKLILNGAILLLASLPLYGQATPVGDRAKGELFVGYSNNQIDIGISDDDNDFQDLFDDRIGAHGFEVSGVYNVSRYFGVKGDFSGHFKNFDVGDPFSPSDVFQVDASLYNFMGGVQVKDNNREGRFKPFAHALVGAAHARTKFNDAFFEGPFCSDPDIDCDDFTESDTGLAMAFGGGIDVRMSRRVSIRAIQVDYNPTRLGGSTQHNVRFGVGLVFH